MKKILIALGLFLVLSASVYTGFKSGYQNGREDVLLISAQGSAHEAASCFEEYRDSATKATIYTAYRPLNPL